MNPLTKDFIKIVIVMCIIVAIAAASSCGSPFVQQEVFVPVDSIVHKDARQIAFYLDGNITTRNLKHVNVINDSVGIIITRTVRR